MKGFEEWTLEDVERINSQRGGTPIGTRVSVEADCSPVGLPVKKSKYRNEKTLADGFVFDSRKEAECWLVCRLREKAGEITELERQVDFPLYAPVLEGPSSRWGTISAEIATYRADITYRDVKDGKRHVVDPKGVRTRMFLLKRKWLELQDGIIIEEI